MKVYLSPSGQYANTYSYGNTTEKEQCTKIALACQAALQRCGIEALCEPDVEFYQRIANADAAGVDLYVPIHTNAFNGQTTGTRMFYYSVLSKGFKACKAIFPYVDELCPGTSSNIKSNPGLIELKKPKAPGAYVECDFHDVPKIAKFIIEHTTEIGEAIAHGICDYFGVKYFINESVSQNTIIIELPKIFRNSSGRTVMALQALLNDYGCRGEDGEKLKVDGIAGANTIHAVKVYQDAMDLETDGIVGADTWGKLLK